MNFRVKNGVAAWVNESDDSDTVDRLLEQKEGRKDDTVQTIPFRHRYRLFLRGILMFFVFASFYFFLVPHTFWQPILVRVLPSTVEKVTIRIESNDYWSPSPVPMPTSRCMIRYVTKKMFLSINFLRSVPSASFFNTSILACAAPQMRPG